MISVANHPLPLSGNSGTVFDKTYFMLKANIRNIYRLIAFLFVLIRGQVAFAQNEKPVKIGLVLPLYIDSVFDANGVYKGNATALPRVMIPGLEFYNGAMLALDDLKKNWEGLEVIVVDSKSSRGVNQELATIQDVDLIIAHFSSRNDIQTLADFTREKNIPLLSATLPNDGGLTNHPEFIMMNPTLRVHIEELYQFMQKYYSLGKMVVVTKNGSTEKMILDLLADAKRNSRGTNLNYTIVQVSDSVQATDIVPLLDSTKRNTVFVGSVQENFAQRLIAQLSPFGKKYNLSMIGMPTWDGLKNLQRSEFKDIELVHSTPYYFQPNDSTINRLTEIFKEKYAGRPSDMVWKGYEAMYHFGVLLIKHKGDLVRNLSDSDAKVFHEFQFKPYFTDKSRNEPDYIENRKLYFIRRINGVIRQVN
ncbi:MAG: ABC transporter substrate-binding protein [Hydrotalea sp.]|nr:ABC transporter substrate-binding protein [Hydrotalea sp.]